MPLILTLMLTYELANTAALTVIDGVPHVTEAAFVEAMTRASEHGVAIPEDEVDPLIDAFSVAEILDQTDLEHTSALKLLLHPYP